MANIYDKNSFFSAYAEMSRSKNGLAAAGEWKQLRKLFPDVKGKQVLDLGCGYGWHCIYAIQQGAAFVTGIDGSQKMLTCAKELHFHEKIQYLQCNLEDFEYPADHYDLVFSNLVLHYIKDLKGIYERVYRTLKQDGCFLFNIEHPVFTAGVNQDWIYDENSVPLYWPLDDYFYPGERQTLFLGQTVQKQHHTLSQIINPLIQTGFQIVAIEEVIPPEEMMDIPGMRDEMRRPMMLLVKVKKTKAS